MSLAFALHLLAAVAWVGGMFFAYQILRPVAASLLEAPLRLELWKNVFARFFPWVEGAIVLLFLSGLWLIRGLGGMAKVGWHVHLMLLLAIAMTAIFFLIRGKLYRGLRDAVGRQDWTEGAARLGELRKAVGLNLILGLIVIAVAGVGRYLG
ncbi:MAG: CopD family protein [Methylococcaceae bacterium]|nr:CopD family protein [Methylococcaceae bacterium]